jgi:hypothetical protein
MLSSKTVENRLKLLFRGVSERSKYYGVKRSHTIKGIRLGIT